MTATEEFLHTPNVTLTHARYAGNNHEVKRLVELKYEAGPNAIILGMGLGLGLLLLLLY
jgi:hypothetical protein